LQNSKELYKTKSHSVFERSSNPLWCVEVMVLQETPSKNNAFKMLVIEDERKLADAIAEGLVRSGCGVSVAYSGEKGLELIHESQVDLIILDIMLPRLGGLETLREMRRGGFKTPVLILTAKASVEDRVRGLDAGADDYLVKPFAFAELLARVRALHRRTAPTPLSALNLADLTLDLNGRNGERGGRHLDLTGREFELLEYLMLNSGTVVSREMFARDVWKASGRYTSLDNVIDVHIARLRRKMDDPFPIKLLHTVRGVGFVLRVEEERRAYEALQD